MRQKLKEYILPGFLLLVAFVACYSKTFLWLNYKYLLPESYYSHGYLIPIVSAYIINTRRSELKNVPLSSDPLGLMFILAALLLHVFGVLGDVNFLSAFSILIYVTGCSLFLLGRSFTREIAFPLSFLMFMVPIPDVFIDTIALPFKSMATTFALSIMESMGIPYIREGFKILFADSSFIVGTPCNGMRSLISFLALGALLMYFIKTSWWKRALFLAAVLPLSIILNGLRIAALMLIAKYLGQEAASPESYLHDGSGFAVFVIGILVMIFFIRKVYETKEP